MNTTKRPLPADHLSIEKAFREAYHEVTGGNYPEDMTLTSSNVEVLQYIMKNFELSDDPLPDGRGKMVRIREKDLTWSTFVCVADNKWYCDGRPLGSRFLSDSQIQKFPWEEI